MTQTYCSQILDLVDRRLKHLEERKDNSGWSDAAWRKELLWEKQLNRSWEQAVEQGRSLSLEYLLRRFSLSRFERHCVYFSLAPELDNRYEQRYAEAQNQRSWLPTLELCLDTFPAPQEERAELLSGWMQNRRTLSFFFQNRFQGEISISDLSEGLKLDRRIVSFLLDPMSGEPALDGVSNLWWSGEEEKTPFLLYEDTLEKMVRRWEEAKDDHLMFYLWGERGSGRRTLARRLCRREKRPLLEVNLAQLLKDAADVESVLIPVCRETVIRDAALALTGLEQLLPPTGSKTGKEDEKQQTGTDWRAHLIRMLKWMAQSTTRLFLISERAWDKELTCEPWQKVELELDVPDTAGRMKLWSAYLEREAVDEGLELEATAIKFALQPGQIAAAAREAVQLCRWEGAGAITQPLLYKACRMQLSHNLGRMASRVNASYTWEDLILPQPQKQMLKNACAQVEYRHRVFDQWGFGKKVAYGQGLSMLFSGPPGTGKTMAAQVIANRLGLELYKVDLSSVMSKYVGETEKQLGVVFDEVKKSQSILFFDEADALFGKRSETKDSHDRYANVQTSYLLQKMEEYDGIIILASNFQQNFDEAFKRRLKYIVEFTLPDREHREQIWRSVLPPQLPLKDDVDFDFLARSFELSGSSIKNIAVAAAFLAAQEDVSVGMVHFLAAAQTEQNKTGKSVGQAELGEYYTQVRAYQATRS